MSPDEETQQPLDISSVVAPPTTAGDAPDAKTAEEIRRAEDLFKLTPTARHLHAVERHLAQQTTDCERLRLQSVELQRELDVLRPRLAALHVSHDLAVDNGALASLSNVIGSAAIAIAGFYDIELSWFRWSLLGGGVAFVLIAVWLSSRAYVYSLPLLRENG